MGGSWSGMPCNLVRKPRLPGCLGEWAVQLRSDSFGSACLSKHSSVQSTAEENNVTIGSCTLADSLVLPAISGEKQARSSAIRLLAAGKTETFAAWKSNGSFPASFGRTDDHAPQHFENSRFKQLAAHDRWLAHLSASTRSTAATLTFVEKARPFRIAMLPLTRTGPHLPGSL
jgi:hypothetical protein